jgi:adenylate cyclase
MSESRGDRPSADGGEQDAKSLHDLRTPLNQIIGYCELLEEEALEGGQDAFVPTLRQIRSAAWQLAGLLDEAFSPPALEEARVELPEEESEKAAHGRLLVVDDNELNRDMLSRRLSSRGYTVSVAGGGKRALEMIEAEAFDLVLLDIMMPEVGGLQVLGAVRARHSRAELPVIMATARDQSQDVVEALRLGANDYVMKPIDFPVVLARIEAHLSLKRAMEEIQRLARSLELRNDFIRRTFGRYLSDEVVAGLLEGSEGLKLGGEKRKVTILMSDLRGFTSVEEALPPEVVVKILNNYLEAMVNVITKHRGTIDEFIGDAILVLFGAPVSRSDDARRAVACAIEMQLAMASVNEWHRRQGLPEVEMGIAVNTGPVVVGNIGSDKRAKYGVVGSHVNLTARIESFTVGGQVLISESTLGEAGPDVRVGRQAAIQAKGFREPITAYELKGIWGEYGLALPDRHEDLKRLDRDVGLRYSVVAEKHAGAFFQPGALVGLSEGAAELRTQGKLPPYTNLRIQFLTTAGDEIPGDVYAKVLDRALVRSDLTFVRFTAVPPEVKKFLRGLLA